MSSMEYSKREGGLPQAKPREGIGLAGELLADLVHVVRVDVAVSAGPDELAWTQVRLLGEHVRQQRVGGDVEGNPQEEVGAALVELT